MMSIDNNKVVVNYIENQVNVFKDKDKDKDILFQV